MIVIPAHDRHSRERGNVAKGTILDSRASRGNNDRGR